MINHFNASLKGTEKEYIFVIGYSFFDPYINNLLFDAAKYNKKLIIVNPYLGPKSLYQEFNHNGKSVSKPKSIESDQFFRVEFTKECTHSKFIDYFKNIQKNSFYSELPEFNNLNIRGENIEYIPLTTGEFIYEFFNNDGDLFTKLIQEFEKEKEEDLPFKDE